MFNMSIVARTALRLKKKKKLYVNMGEKKVHRKKRLTSTDITLYASVSDIAPGNESVLPLFLGLSGPVPATATAAAAAAAAA